MKYVYHPNQLHPYYHNSLWSCQDMVHGNTPLSWHPIPVTPENVEATMTPLLSNYLMNANRYDLQNVLGLNFLILYLPSMNIQQFHLTWKLQSRVFSWNEDLSIKLKSKTNCQKITYIFDFLEAVPLILEQTLRLHIFWHQDCAYHHTWKSHKS